MGRYTWERIEAVFREVLEAPRDEREGVLAKRCEDDPELRREVEAMLEAHDNDEPLHVERLLSDGGAHEENTVIGQRVGVYRLQGRLGQGGMGDVYLAERDDDEFHQVVAIKLVRPGYRAAALADRFRRERQILARLTHPNIATLLDGGVAEDGRPYLVMEYVEGDPITEYCAANALSLPARLRLFRSVCAAVQFAHANLVVHRDLKPANILVTATGQVKLLDFGIAKLLDDDDDGEVTRPLDRIMTPEYAAPEQVVGGAVTTSTDVYGLGVLLYELLTGRRPLRVAATSPTEIERVVCETEPVRPSVAVRQTQGGEDVPSLRYGARQLRGELDNITLMALRKDPERRYASVFQFDEDVERFLAGQPVAAQRDTVSYRMRKFVGRHAVGVAVTAIVALLVVGFSAISVRQAREVAVERDRAETERDRAHEEQAKAQVEREKAEHVVDMLVGMFESSNPHVSPGGDTLRVATFLAEGEAQIDALTDQPLVQARLWEVMGKIHHGRTRYERALALFGKAFAVYEPHTGPDGSDAARVAHAIAQVTLLHRGPVEAEPLLRESLSRQLRILGEGHPDVAQAMQDLAGATADSNERAELLESALAVRRLTMTENSMGVAASLNSIATLHWSNGRFERARDGFAEVLSVLEQNLPPDHPNVLVVRTNLAAAYAQLGDWGVAEAMHRDVLEARRRVVGPESMVVAASLEAVGFSLANQGKHADAEAAFRESVRIFERNVGVRHWRTANALRNLAIIAAMRGRIEEGIVYLDSAIAIDVALRDTVSTSSAYKQGQKSQMLLALGRTEEAELLARSARSVVKDGAPPEGSLSLADADMYLGMAILHSAAAGDAEPLFRRAHEFRMRRLPASHPKVAAAACGLGAALAAQGRYDEAEHLLAVNLPVIESWGLAGTLLPARARLALADTYDALDRPDEAARYRGR